MHTTPVLISWSFLALPLACLADEAQRRGGVCLVHCKSGMSRSGSVAIAYLMHAKQMTLLDALTFCRNKRPIISPNPGASRPPQPQPPSDSLSK